jgi:eukaryotic-like serine/threonine-protein kinase
MTGENRQTSNLIDQELRSERCQLEPGATAGDYVVTDFIAQGGFGSVYGATHRTTGQDVALKVMHQTLTTLPKMVQRFRREVELLNLVCHPGIVRVWTVGALADKRPFFAMERLKGKTVAVLLEEAGRLAPDDAVEIFVQVCEALAAAHRAGVIHRDVKPTNIVVLDGAPRAIKLLDFGVAKLVGPAFITSSSLTSEGRPVGTPTSMAPEQILGSAVDHRVDIYALGVLLYRLLTGRPPFFAPSALAQMRLHLLQPPPRPSLRVPAAAPLDAIVLRCMQKDRDLRFGSIEELLSTLRATVSRSSLRSEDVSSADDLAAAVHVDIRVSEGGDDSDGRLADSVGAMLDISEDGLCDAGMLIGLATGNQLLGVQPLSMEPAAIERELVQVVSIAAALREMLDRRERSDPRVRATICVHVGEIVLRACRANEIAGGALLRADMWAPRASVSMVCLTAAAARLLDRTQLPPRIAALVSLAPVDPECTLSSPEEMAPVEHAGM